MGMMDMATAVLLVVTAVIGVVGLVMVYRRMRRQAQDVTETQEKPEEAPHKIEELPSQEEKESQEPETERRQTEAEKRPGAKQEHLCGAKEGIAFPGEEKEERPREHESQGIEEEHHKPDERPNGLEGEAPPKEEEERPKDKQKRKRVPPGGRGGRRRGLPPGGGKQIGQEGQQRRQKAEIICWQRERTWRLAVEVPEDLLEYSNLSVSQNALPLTQDASREACWLLNQACGEVEVCWTQDGAPSETKIVLGEKDYLIFKLSGQKQNQGRRISLPSFGGSYLVIVPEDWHRDEALSGPPPWAPEPSSLPGYQGHFFLIEKGGDGKIAFRSGDDKPVVIEPKVSRLELVGVRLNDASEDIGPLFGVGPPKIRALDNHAWEDIEEIVVGSEGGGETKWRRQFSADPREMEQAMPSEVAARKGGWYFLRFYDKNDDLLDSLDFRFLSTLREIRIPPSSPVPSEGGHMPVKVELIHESNCVVEPADNAASRIQVQHEDNKSILTIPPNAAYDRTSWRVGTPGGPQVEVAVLVERLWWAVGQEDNTPSEWGDKPLTLLPGDFVATSNKALWLRLPRRRWVDTVLVGFERGRPYAVRVGESTIAIPFRDFSDSPEVEKRTEEHLFKVWVKRQDARVYEAIVGIIQAPKPPTEERDLCFAFGRYKTAVAKAILQRKPGVITVNNYPLEDYFKNAPLRAKRFLRRLLQSEQVRIALLQAEVSIIIVGSGPGSARQAKAAAHALARVLTSYDPTLKVPLKQSGFGGARVRKVPTVLRKE